MKLFKAWTLIGVCCLIASPALPSEELKETFSVRVVDVQVGGAAGASEDE